MLLQPTSALTLFTTGLLLIYWELNRPGRVLPGALGLTAALLAIAALLHHDLNPAPAVLVVTAGAPAVLDLLRPTPPAVPISATLALACGLAILTSPRPNPIVAVLCALVLGTTTFVLTRIARRARANKRVN